SLHSGPQEAGHYSRGLPMHTPEGPAFLSFPTVGRARFHARQHVRQSWQSSVRRPHFRCLAELSANSYAYGFNIGQIDERRGTPSYLFLIIAELLSQQESKWGQSIVTLFCFSE